MWMSGASCGRKMEEGNSYKLKGVSVRLFRGVNYFSAGKLRIWRTLEGLLRLKMVTRRSRGSFERWWKVKLMACCTLTSTWGARLAA